MFATMYYQNYLKNWQKSLFLRFKIYPFHCSLCCVINIHWCVQYHNIWLYYPPSWPGSFSQYLILSQHNVAISSHSNLHKFQTRQKFMATHNAFCWQLFPSLGQLLQGLVAIGSDQVYCSELSILMVLFFQNMWSKTYKTNLILSKILRI